MGSEGMMASSGFALMAAASRAWLWKCQSEPGKQTPTQENRSPACAASLGTDYPQRVPKPPGNDELDPASLAKARLGAWLLSLQRTSRSAVDGWPDPGEGVSAQERRRPATNPPSQSGTAPLPAKWSEQQWQLGIGVDTRV